MDEATRPVQLLTVEEDRLGSWADTREGPLVVTLYDTEGRTLTSWQDVARRQDGGCCDDYWQVDEP